MYKIENKVTTVSEEERAELKRTAAIAIYSELMRYIEADREEPCKTA